mgnify:CR=1 FL=1
MLAVAVGIYLPFELEVPIFVGGLIAWFAEQARRRHGAGLGERHGLLFAAGLITGEAIVGILMAIPIVITSNPSRIDPTKADAVSTIEEALEEAGDSHPFFIGGRGIFSHSLLYVNHFLLTTIEGRWPADVYFKVPFLESKVLLSEERWTHPDDPSLNCTFREYENED